MRNAIGFVSLINPRRPKRVAVSGLAHLFLRPIEFARIVEKLAAILIAFSDQECANTSVPVPPPAFMWSSMHTSVLLDLLLIHLMRSSRLRFSGTSIMTYSLLGKEAANWKREFATLRTHLYSVLEGSFGSIAPWSRENQSTNFQFSFLSQLRALLWPQDINIFRIE